MSYHRPFQTQPYELPPPAPALVVSATPAPEKAPWPITRRQEEILTLLSTGATNADAARTLGVGEKSIAQTLALIRKNMKARNTLHAVIKYDRWARRTQ
jgi:DNA-binding NarL/FixJ family response regulator